MSQLIEGVDNEVALACILFTGAAAIALPWYFFRPSTRHSQHQSQRGPDSRMPTSETIDNRESTGIGGATNNRISDESEGSPTEMNINGSNIGQRYDAGFQNQSDQQPITVDGREGPHQSQVENISVKVKHNTTDQIYSVPKTMTLINFKRHCYRSEMEEGKNVRLIYNGRILGGDHYTLEFLGINNGCVIHAQISDHQNTQGIQTTMDMHDLDIGFLFVPMMSLAFILGWTFVVAFDDLFSVTSVVILSFLTGIFILLTYLT